MSCALNSVGPEILMKVTYPLFQLADLDQTKHDIVLPHTNEDDYVLGLVQIGQLEPKICHVH